MEGVPGGERQTDVCVDASGGGGAAGASQCVREVTRGLLTQELLVKRTASKLNDDINNSASDFTKKTGFLKR